MYLRIFLFLLLGWLIIRAILQYAKPDERRGQNFKSDSKNDRKVSKETGEYVDYEEVDD